MTIIGLLDFHNNPLQNTDIIFDMEKKPAVIMGLLTYILYGKQEGFVNFVIAKYPSPHDKLITIPSDVYFYSDIIHVIDVESYTHLYVIGGHTIYEWFASRRLFDEIYFVREPDELALINKYFPQVLEIEPNIDHYVFHNKEEMKVADLFKRVLMSPLTDNRLMPAYVLYSQQLDFELNGKLPLSSMRRQYFKGIFHELMWMINGRTDLEYLHSRNVHVWDANVATPQIGANVPSNDIGKTYGYQWRNFGGRFDQLKYIIDEINTNPHSRRLVMSAWCPPDIFESSVLPPCGMMYVFSVDRGELRLHVFQRSSDMALALNWNIVSASLLAYLVAKTCGLVAKSLSMTFVNLHIYKCHESAVRTMLEREILSYPNIEVLNKCKIEEYRLDDILVYNYHPHPHIKLEMLA